MFKNWFENYRGLVALGLFAFAFLGCLGTSVPSFAGAEGGAQIVPVPSKKPMIKAQIPLPSRKPGFEVSVKSAQFDPRLKKEKSAGLLDLTSALSAFSKPPVPRLKPFASAQGALSEKDAGLYKSIFSLQADGKMKEADRDIQRLSDLRLRGYVLYQRYMHPTAYKSSFEELKNWMALYSDYPGAQKIYRLATLKMPRGSAEDLKKPVVAQGVRRYGDPAIYRGKHYHSTKKRDAGDLTTLKALNKKLASLNSKGELGSAYDLLKGAHARGVLDDVEFDLRQADIAAGYLYHGDIKDAGVLAGRSLKGSGLHVPTAAWVAGLVSWLGEDYDKAAGYFESVARSPYSSGWVSASGSYWAARAHMRRGDVKAVSIWLKRAAEHPRTFYGLIATRALGRDFDFNWNLPAYDKKYQKILAENSAGSRAIALVAAGQAQWAEAELLRVDPGNDKDLRGALLAYAGYAGLPALALRLGNAFSTEKDGVYYDAALYPVGSWQPKGGYTVDAALIHAIMRQESRFDPSAESPSGARGLMQLMPATARYVVGQNNLKAKYRAGEALENPQLNLEIGQRYVASLLEDKFVDGDVSSLLIAYNAGPGNLARWKRQWQDVSDPLLFVELIPAVETRRYVERVLSNYWMYRMRGNLPTLTLDNMAAGKKAGYAYIPEEAESYRLASRN